MQIPQHDGDGYLVDMSDWAPEIGRLMGKADGYELNDKKWEQIMKAREYYEGFGPMKPITKYGGTPNLLAAPEQLPNVQEHAE